LALTGVTTPSKHAPKHPKTPLEEEEEQAGGGGAESEREERGAAEEEGTSMVMVGAVGF
jgi:hypothetical protein